MTFFLFWLFFMARRYALRDDQWHRIEPLLTGRAGHTSS